MTQPSEKSRELQDRVPHALPEPAPDNDSGLPFDRAYFERHKEELKRNSLFGRVALVLVIFALLVANLVLTQRNTRELVDNINWARAGQSSGEDSVAVQLKAVEARLKVLEEQNRALVQALNQPVAPQTPPVAAAGPK